MPRWRWLTWTPLRSAAHRACASRPWLLRQRVPGNQWQPLCCSNWRVRSRQGRTATGTFSTANSYKNSPSRFGVGELVPLFGGALNWSSPHGRFLLRLLLLLRTFWPTEGLVCIALLLVTVTWEFDRTFLLFLSLQWIQLHFFPLMFGAGVLSYRSFAFGFPSDSREGGFHVWSSHTRLLPPWVGPTGHSRGKPAQGGLWVCFLFAT